MAQPAWNDPNSSFRNPRPGRAGAATAQHTNAPMPPAPQRPAHDSWGADAANTMGPQVGESGAHIKATQQWLRSHGLNVPTNGIWDSTTQQAASVFRTAWKGGSDPHGFQSAVHWFNNRLDNNSPGARSRVIAHTPVGGSGVTPHGNPADKPVPPAKAPGHAADRTPAGNAAGGTGDPSGATPNLAQIGLGQLGLNPNAQAANILNKLGMPQGVNENQYANAVAAMQFGPTLKLLRDQLAQSRASLPAALNQLDQGYSHAQGVAETNAKDIQNTGAGLLAQQGTASQNFLRSLGVDANSNPGLAHVLAGDAQRGQDSLGASVNNADAQAKQAVTDQAFDGQLARQAYTNNSQRQQQDLQSQIAAQTLAEGGARVKGLTDAQTLNQQRLAQWIQNRSSLENQMGIEAMLPGNIEAQGLANQGAGLANEGTALANTGRNLDNMTYLQRTSDQHSLAQGQLAAQKFSQMMQQKNYKLQIRGQDISVKEYLAKMGDNGGGNWKDLQSSGSGRKFIQDMQNNALGYVYDAKAGSLRQDPNKTFDNLRGFVSKLGLNPDSPKGREFILGTMRNTNYQNYNGQAWHYNSQKGRFFINGTDTVKKAQGASSPADSGVFGLDPNGVLSLGDLLGGAPGLGVGGFVSNSLFG